MAQPDGADGPVQHYTSDFFEEGPYDGDLVVILLNWVLPKETPALWAKASLRICADGGANRLYHEFPALVGAGSGDSEPPRLPHAIIGDLDSIEPEVLRFYTAAGCEVRDLSHDQDSTDLTKCLVWAQAQLEELRRAGGHRPKAGEGSGADGACPPHPLRRATFVVAGAHGGRLDHTLGNLSVLHQCRDLDVVLLGDGNLTRLLRAGRTVVRPCRAVEGPHCGVIPLAGAATVHSRGLRWDMDGLHLSMGGMISSCNQIAADAVEIAADLDVIWTTQCST